MAVVSLEFLIICRERTKEGKKKVFVIIVIVIIELRNKWGNSVYSKRE